MSDVRTEGAVLLVGLPSYGDVGPIAVRILLDHVKRHLAGTFQSDDFPPTAFAWEGVVSGPMQVWAADAKGAADMLILNSDIVLVPEAMSAFARTLAEWAEERKIRLIVCLEGRPPDNVDAEPRIVTNILGEPFVDKVEAEVLHSKLTGFAAAILSRANPVGVPAVAILAVVEIEQQDAAASAAALDAARPLLPDGVVPEDLAELARATEEKVRSERSAQREVERRMRSPGDVGYV